MGQKFEKAQTVTQGWLLYQVIRTLASVVDKRAVVMMRQVNENRNKLEEYSHKCGHETFV